MLAEDERVWERDKERLRDGEVAMLLCQQGVSGVFLLTVAIEVLPYC